MSDKKETSKSKVKSKPVAIIHQGRIVTRDDGADLIKSGKARLATPRDYDLAGIPHPAKS